MFDDLRRSFKQAIENFKTEVSRDSVPEAVDRLLKAMQQETTDTRMDIERLKEEVVKVGASADRQTHEAEVCERRQHMAEEIDDEETADVAKTFAEKHRRHAEILKEKQDVLRQELKLREHEYSEMLVKIKEARANRSSLEATAGRAQAQGTFNQSNDLFSELDRMADKISDLEATGEAAEELGQEFDAAGTQNSTSFSDDPDFSSMDAANFDAEIRREQGHASGSPADSVEDRLAELKRRMGEDG